MVRSVWIIPSFSGEKKKKKRWKKPQIFTLLISRTGLPAGQCWTKTTLASILTGLLNFYKFSPLRKGEQKLGQLLTAGKRKKKKILAKFKLLKMAE